MGDLGEVGFEVAFPDGEGVDVLGFEGLEVVLVAFAVAADFFSPEGAVGFGEGVGGTAFATVPEASVDEDGEAGARDIEVGFAGEAGVVFAVAAESGGPEGFAEEEFRLGVFGLVGLHGLAGGLADDEGFSQAVEAVGTHETTFIF